MSLCGCAPVRMCACTSVRLHVFVFEIEAGSFQQRMEKRDNVREEHIKRVEEPNVLTYVTPKQVTLSPFDYLRSVSCHFLRVALLSDIHTISLYTALS